MPDEQIHPKHLVAGFYTLLGTVCLIALLGAGVTAYVVVENDRHPAMTVDPGPQPKPVTPPSIKP